MSKLWDDLFGHRSAAQIANVNDDSHYDAIAKSYAANLSNSMHKSISALKNGTAPGHMNAVSQQALRPAPEPKDVPALAISLDVAYDLWAAKHGYEWVNINATRTVPTGAGGGVSVPSGWVDPRGIYGGSVQPNPWPQAVGTFTATVDIEPSEPEFDWYTVARRLVHVRALENEGGYYRLVPREWCK